MSETWVNAIGSALIGAGFVGMAIALHATSNRVLLLTEAVRVLTRAQLAAQVEAARRPVCALEPLPAPEERHHG